MSTAVSIIVALLRLLSNTDVTASAVRASSPTAYLTEDGSRENALAANLYATPKFSAEVLLGLAYVESRYSAVATSRVESGRRITGNPSWETPPKGVTGKFFCGVTQAEAQMSWDRCQELRNVFEAYREAADELTRWSSACYMKYPHLDNLTCALTGYNGGFPGIETGTSYAVIVLFRAGLIKKAKRLRKTFSS